ncbi:MAG: hypothetical protein CMJ64_11715 [Planctomycetaceae bacterium]|nr:hypothetical protein [Planctomycetaceae bacterium]
MKTMLTLLTCCLTLAAQPALADETGQQPPIRFNDQIRPILSEYCFACHGPDSASRKADLRLDTPASALASKLVVPGKAAESELIARINSDDPEFVMPPPAFRKTLEPKHQQVLANWINAGAKWQEHWSFIKPERHELPKPDDVAAWARNPTDHFVFAKLRELGLKPNEPADRYSLARRAALDLTGLPPTKEMLSAFVSDNTEGAYERYVDKLLNSSHAGEHRARYWLDAARYGDTHGMHVDNYREIWPYRDWVINAFNTNMPFDQFVVEQIAGDLLPEPTLNQRIATGFNRCNITTSEGGAIPAELDVRYMVDRVETTATVFLGLTAGCGVCHDHKFDPITQREFYQLGAFFNNTTQPAMDGNKKDTPPVVALPGEEFQQEWNTLLARRKELRAQLDKQSADVPEWWESHPPVAEHPVATDELILWLPLAEGEGEALDLPASAAWATDHPTKRRGVRFGEGGELSVKLPKIRSDQPLTISFWFRTPDRVLPATDLFDQTTTTEDGKVIGWKINSNSRGDVRFEIADGTGKKIQGLLPDNEALRPKSWQHVCVRYSGGQCTSSISILANGTAAFLRNSNEEYISAVELADVPLNIGKNLPTAGLSDLRVFRRFVSDNEVQLLVREYELRTLLQGAAKWDALKPEQRELLTSFYRHKLDEGARSLARELAATEQRRDFIYGRSTTTLVMQERPTKPRAWVLARGEYDQRRDEVEAGVPAVLPELPDGAARNRLGLARWLVHPDHPLTARVIVNRLWQSIFGSGIVKTSEDFGVMGDRPTHPKLLDWLAVEFVESDWDVNHILKLIVTSAAYRQSSVVTAEKLEADVANRYLTRGSRLRLDAEVLRDQALSVSALLRRDIGGPSVKPYQPAGLWNVVAITGSNTRVFERDSGDALYRRSVYTFWKRTSPPPSLAAFNAPTREQCTVRRERTNTPIQALVLMNDPQFVEAGRRLAEHTLREQQEDQSRAKWMLQTVLSRPPSADDVADITLAAAELRAIFAKDDEAAKALINTGDSKPNEKLDAAELAAWTMVANTLMNRDDFINK